MSTKYILAALGLALVRAGEVLVAHSDQFDNFVNEVSPERLGLSPQPHDTTATPAAASVPTPAAQVTPTQIANAELDADGLPWDARIHAGTKSKTQKKQWTRKKGVDDAVFDAVIAELRQQYPAAADTTPTTTAPAATVTAPVATPPAAPAISVPAASAPLTPYAQLTDWLAKNTGAGKALTAEWVNEQFAANSTSLPALAANQEASAQFLEAFRGVLKQMGVAEA